MEEVTESVPVEITSAGTVITEVEYYTLLGMLKSSDSENHKIAQLLLNRCDVAKSIYWIYKLSNEYASRMVYLRTKASREFQKSCDLFTISYKKPEYFAKWLVEKNWLTPDIFQRLKSGILSDLKRQCSNEYFDIYVTLREKYAEYDPSDTHQPL